MKRRSALGVAASLGVAWLVAARAQPKRLRRVGILSLSQAGTEAVRVGDRMFLQALRRFGWEEGSNFVFEPRYAEGDLDRLETAAADLARSEVDLIVTVLSAPTAAAQRASRTIPIVMIGTTLPVERGFIERPSRPGGNVTGTVVPITELYVKSLQLLRELDPGRRRVAMLEGPLQPDQLRLNRPVREEVAKVANGLGLGIEYFDLGSDGDIGGTLERIAASRADMMSVGNSGLLDMRVREVVDLAQRHRILTTGTYTLFATFGGAMYYGSNLQDIIDRSASFVDRVLRGASPGELPIESPTRYDFILNRKTLRALGILPPRSVLLRATELID